MNSSLEHLKDGYFKCFHETIKATWEVLADLNEVDATYVDSVLEAMRKWQVDVSLAMTAMHTEDCTMWDAKCKALNEATQKFGEKCEVSQVTCAKICKAHRKALVKGDEDNPVVILLEKVLKKTRVAANHAVEGFQKKFEQALLPHVPPEHLPVLVSNAYNTVSQFSMSIWQMVADECIMPMQHDYLTNFGLATIMQHALEQIPNTCMMIVPPRPPESKDDLATFLDSLGNVSLPPASTSMMAPLTASSNVPPNPGVLSTGGLGMAPASTTATPVFGSAPHASVSAGIVTGVSLFPTSVALPPGFESQPPSISVASTSSAPATASMPKGSGSAASLPVSLPLLGHPGGRSSFLTDAIQAGNLADMDEEGDTAMDRELRKIAGDVTRKHGVRSKHVHNDDIDTMTTVRMEMAPCMRIWTKPRPHPQRGLARPRVL